MTRLGECYPNRFVSITFDDGLLAGAMKAVSLLDRFGVKATFYPVTGWVRPNQVSIRDPWNAGRDHGSWSDWALIEQSGHDIGSHTVSHINATSWRARWSPFLLRWELQRSYKDLSCHLRRPPVSAAMPWNATTQGSESLAKQFYHAARLGQGTVCYNNLARIDWYRLSAWAPDSDVSSETMCDSVAQIPPNHWLILAFHSLDDEGWMPLASSKLQIILQYITNSLNLRHATIRDMIENYKVAKIAK